MQYREYQSDDLPPAQPATEPASPWARLAAVIIDGLIYAAVVVVFAIIAALTFSANQSDEEFPLAIILAATVAVIIVLIIQMVLLGTRGQTIGKIALNIRIVDAQTGAHPGWPRLVLLRAIVNGILTGIPFLGGIYWIVDSLFVFRADHRTIHDLYSGTRVDKVMG